LVDDGWSNRIGKGEILVEGEGVKWLCHRVVEKKRLRKYRGGCSTSRKNVEEMTINVFTLALLARREWWRGND
jgi:hypothetical protein